MAHHTEQTGFPALPLQANMRLRLRALSTTTDAEVTGVVASVWSIYGRDKSAGLPQAEELPTWVPEEDGGTV